MEDEVEVDGVSFRRQNVCSENRISGGTELPLALYSARGNRCTPPGSSGAPVVKF